MRRLLILLPLLTGCAYAPVAIDKGREANDTAVQSAEWVICYAASVGSIQRAFGHRPDAWMALCEQPFFDVIGSD